MKGYIRTGELTLDSNLVMIIGGGGMEGAAVEGIGQVYIEFEDEGW